MWTGPLHRRDWPILVLEPSVPNSLLSVLSWCGKIMIKWHSVTEISVWTSFVSNLLLSVLCSCAKTMMKCHLVTEISVWTSFDLRLTVKCPLFMWKNHNQVFKCHPVTEISASTSLVLKLTISSLCSCGKTMIKCHSVRNFSVNFRLCPNLL